MRKYLPLIFPALAGIFLVTATILYLNNPTRILNEATETRNEFLTILSDTIHSDSEDVSEAESIISKLELEIQVKENNITRMQSCADINKLYEGTLQEPINCDTIPVLKRPDELFYGLKKSDNPYVSQPEDDHYHPGAWAVLATDIATGFKAEIYAPDFLNQVKMYTVEVMRDTRIGSDDVEREGPLGNYLKLNWKDWEQEYYWILAHVKTRLETGDIVYTGQRIWQMDLSWATTGYHLHQELWWMVGDEWKNLSYTGRSKALLNARTWVYDNDGIGIPIYFTYYDLWFEDQNDSTPCIWASWVDLCELAKTGVQSVAITVDIRNLYWIKLKDTVTLKHIDTGTEYQVEVHDEKASRFRTNCYRDSGQYCNKWDIAHYNWVSNNWMSSWDYLILK